ncbi:MAG: type II toxin-antitoxin system PemK/MazF family toxin [Verrucomicrobiota bacterium]
MATQSINPQRGEIWKVNFDPQVGSEIQKERPAVVLDRGHSNLSVRVIVPVTTWKPKRDEQNPFKVYLQDGAGTGLTKECAADACQIKTADLERFVKKLGTIGNSKADEIAEAVGLVIDLPSLGDAE